MEKTKMIEELLSCGRNVLRELHNAYGFDFEAPLYIERFDKPFTLGFARKLAEYNGYGGDAKKVFCVRYGYEHPWLVSIGFPDKDVEVTYRRDTLKNGVKYFESKSAFKKEMKDGEQTIYLICQKREFVKNPAPDRVWAYGWTERFKPMFTTYFDEDGCCFYTRPKCDFNGKPINGVTADFDKSGYCVGERRAYWYNEAQNLRYTRARAAVDYDVVRAKYEELQEAVSRRKEELVDMLTKATTVEEVRAVAKALADGYSNGYASALSDLAWYKQRMNTESFDSMSDVAYHFNATARNLNMA